ncbi:hypothetical protein GCM10025792_43570 [Pseudonocardia tropica]
MIRNHPGAVNRRAAKARRAPACRATFRFVRMPTSLADRARPRNPQDYGPIAPRRIGGR